MSSDVEESDPRFHRRVEVINAVLDHRTDGQPSARSD
jgi:hypothetical protein